MRKGSNKLKLPIEKIAVFQSKIKRLPGYLAIQFVRFYYKEKEAINAKILKVYVVYCRFFIFHVLKSSRFASQNLMQILIPHV